MKFKDKEQVHDYLNHSKVYVDGQSKEVQEVLFKYGFLREIDVDKVKDEPVITDEIGDTFNPFIFVDDNVFITGSSMDRFQKNPNIEFDFDEILSIELEKVPKRYEFKPFDKVLVRDSDDKDWDFDFFKRYNPSCPFPYICLENNYRDCIPYEGNENLMDKPYNHEDEE